MNWTCAAEPIWNLFVNPLISLLITMMTQIDPPDYLELRQCVCTLAKPASCVRHIDEAVQSSPVLPKDFQTSRWAGPLDTEQTRQVGGPKMETGLGLLDDRRGSEKSFWAPKLSTDSLQYLFTFSTTVLHFCIYAIGGFPTAWRCSCNSSFIGLWNTCSRPEPCKKKKVRNLKLLWFVTYLCI